MEGAEFEVLPRLISTRVLCRVRFLLIEWHLKNLPPEKRAAGLAMKEALAGILASSCRTPPELVHDDMPLNNQLPTDTPGLHGRAAFSPGGPPWHLSGVAGVLCCTSWARKGAVVGTCIWLNCSR